MNIHEHQAKELLRQYNIPTPSGYVAFTTEEAIKVSKKLPGPIFVVKAQIHAGGRGKAGGVKVVKNVDEVKNSAETILGKNLITHQTGPEGKLVQRLYIEDGCDISAEYYFSMVVDRVTSRVSVIASTEGGMDIEEVAEETPELLHKVNVDPNAGLMGYQVRDLGLALGLSGAAHKSFAKMLRSLYALFVQEDCAMVEINPLVRTGDDEMVALDAKVSFDENAEFRHKSWDELRDLSEEEDVEIRAKETGLSYVKLDGNIGCLVNGAGLAMATMDVIKLYGGEPANFLDVGGGANEEQVKTAFSIILEDPNVKGILVNIFGGIMRCDIIARGVIAATEALDLNVPLVVRLAGTNVDEGKAILAASTLNIHPADDLAEGAQKIVQLIGGEA